MDTIFEKYLYLIGYDIKEASRRLNEIQLLSNDEFYNWKNKKKMGNSSISLR